MGRKPSELAPFADAEETFSRYEKHLADNGVAPEKTKLHLGRALAVDAGKETFTNGGHDAEGLLSRTYRPGFVVPPSA